MARLRCAVIGVGYLGRFHAQKYAMLDDCELVAVVDTRPEQAQALAQSLNCQALTDYRDLIGRVDVVSVVVPTQGHHEVCAALLRAGIHVLVEKPITTTLAQADELIALARQAGVLLAVGHLERFNPAVQALLPHLQAPRFIESVRLAPYKPRATDVSVLLDLMIHDVDLILTLAGSEPVQVDASGARVLTQDIDIANARIRFANGCVANITASRVSAKSERKMRVFQSQACFSLDLGQRTLTRYTSAEGPEPGIQSTPQQFGEADALLAEITDFVQCVRSGRTPKVPGEAGRHALEVVQRIAQATELIS